MFRSKCYISTHLLIIASTNKFVAHRCYPHFTIFATFFVATFQNLLKQTVADMLRHRFVLTNNTVGLTSKFALILGESKLVKRLFGFSKSLDQSTAQFW